MQKNKIFKLILSAVIGFGAASMGVSASAQELSLGAQVGALGRGNQTDIGYGPYIEVNPLGWAAFKWDAAFTSFDGASFWMTTPAAVFYPVDFSEFKVGLSVGPGFYKYEGIETKFGLHAGTLATFSVIDELAVGLEGRYHGIFGAVSDGGVDVWSVMMTLAYKFEVGGGW